MSGNFLRFTESEVFFFHAHSNSPPPHFPLTTGPPTKFLENTFLIISFFLYLGFLSNYAVTLSNSSSLSSSLSSYLSSSFPIHIYVQAMQQMTLFKLSHFLTLLRHYNFASRNFKAEISQPILQQLISYLRVSKLSLHMGDQPVNVFLCNKPNLFRKSYKT